MEDFIKYHKPKYLFGRQKKNRDYSTISPGLGTYNHKEFIGKEAPKKTMGIKKSISNTDITPGRGNIS